MIDTDASLLDRLKTLPAHVAWREFYDGYWSAIGRYARKLGLDAHQAEEVLQETMVALMRILPAFSYDQRKGRFRNFLLTIVHRKALAALRRIRTGGTISLEEAQVEVSCDGSVGFTALTPEESTAALVRWREALFEDALAALRESETVEPHALAVFEAYAIRAEPAAAVAARFGLNENAVYQIKNRLTRRLRQEVERRMVESGSDHAARPGRNERSEGKLGPKLPGA